MAGNDDWVWDSKHFRQVGKMLGALTRTSGCALHVRFNKYLHLCDLNGFHGRMQFSLWVGNVHVWSYGCLEVSGVSLQRCNKGREELNGAPYRNNNKSKPGMFYNLKKMAVSLYTNTRPQEIKNDDGSLLRRKPREECLGFTSQSQKCFKSRQKMLHFWVGVQQW